MYRQYPQTPLQFLGAPVSVCLTNGDVLRGEVFCYDGSDTVILKQQIDSDHASFRIIKVQHVREINGHGPPPPSIEIWLPSCNTKVLEERERKALSSFEARKHTIGIGVTQEAQEIFNFIHKTHPDCCWTRDRRISVMGVTVNPPYGSDDCEGGGRALDRIKQVVKRFRQRRQTDKNRTSPPTMPTASEVSVQVQAGQTVPYNPVHPYSEDMSGLTYMAGTSIMSVGPNGIADTNGVMMLQPSPAGPGGGVFMMVVHGGDDQRGGQQMLATAPGHPGPFFAPVLVAGPNGTAIAAPQGSILGAVPPQSQIYDPTGRPMIDASGVPVLCQVNAPLCQEDGGPSMPFPQMRSGDPGRSDIIPWQHSGGIAPPPPHSSSRPSPSASSGSVEPITAGQQQPTPPHNASEAPESPQSALRPSGGPSSTFNAPLGGQWCVPSPLPAGNKPNRRPTHPSTPNAGPPAAAPTVAGDSASHSVSSTPKATVAPNPAPALDTSSGGPWIHTGNGHPQQRNSAGSKNVRNQRRGARRREG